MGITSQLPDGITEFDVIIAGGGTAGCIVAARLSEADPNLSILLIEGGRNNHNDPTIINPVLFLSHLLPTSETTLFWQGNAEDQLGGRSLVVPTGGVLGGGSSINLMMYSRAQRSDWDSWKTPGWYADEIIPYLKKLETYHGPGTLSTHGSDGPVQISGGTYRAERFVDDFIQAITQVGWHEIEDLQNLGSNNGVQRAVRFIGPDGKRQDSAHTYLHPKLQDGNHPNLHILVESQVVRVLFDGKRAVGVEYQPNPAFQDNSTVKSVTARKLVVVSAGALGSPLVLERSGVGNLEILERAGVTPVEELPGVGSNFQDHHLLVYPYKSSLNPDETFDAIAGGRVDPGELIASKADIVGWNAQDMTCKLRPTDADVSALGPEFEAAWNRDFKNDTNRPLMLISPIAGFPGDPSTVEAGQYFANTVFSVYPYSRGHVHIKSTSLGDPVDFVTGFFSEPVDITKHIWAYKKQREIARRLKTYRGEVAGGHPPFAPGSEAACIQIDAPLTDVKDIKYTAEDDAVLKQWLIENVSTTWHSLGTNKMAPRETGGVVDENLGVYGLEALKVADLSIVPANVAANTANTAFVIGEKAADIFIKELGLPTRNS